MSAKLTLRIEEVLDGDTVVSRLGTRRRQIHLVDIDAPEMGQEFGAQASVRLAGWVLGREVKLELLGDDDAGDLRGRLFGEDGRDVGLRLLADGLAWLQPGGAAEAKAIERSARRDRKGLWRDEKPIPPWQWRQ